MRFRKPNISPKFSAEEERLSKEQKATRLRMEQLEKELQAYPRQIEANKARHREMVKMRATLAAPAISLRGDRVGRNSYQKAQKLKKLPARELNSARIKFLGLCLILATIIFMLWRSIPS